MAKIKITPGEVVFDVKLSEREAQALYAVLSEINDRTESTDDFFWELDSYFGSDLGDFEFVAETCTLDSAESEEGSDDEEEGEDDE